MLRQQCRSQAPDDLRNRRCRPSPIFVETIEHSKGRERADHVLGLPDRAPGTQIIGGGQPLSQQARPIRVALVRRMRKVAMQRRCISPDLAAKLNVVIELLSRRAFSRRGFGMVAWGEGGEQAGFGAELVVDGDPRHPGSRRYCADTGITTGADELSSGGQDRLTGGGDSGLAAAEAIGMFRGRINLTDSMFKQCR